MRSRGNVAVAPDLRTAPNERMRIDHRAFAHVRANVHKHRRHTNYPAPDVTAVANAGAARNNAHAVGSRERPHRIRGLVKERLSRCVDGHVRDRAHSKAQQNSLLHPGVCAPARFCGGIRFGGANVPAVQRCFEIAEKPLMFFFIMRWRIVKQLFNLRRLHAPS